MKEYDYREDRGSVRDTARTTRVCSAVLAEYDGIPLTAVVMFWQEPNVIADYYR